MADSTTPTEAAHAMLDRIAESEKVLSEVKAARSEGRRDERDRADVLPFHQHRAAALYQGAESEDVALPVETAAVVEGLIERDLLAGREHLVEQCLAAYIAEHGAEGLPEDWQTTLADARGMVDGKRDGPLDAKLVDRLAKAERRFADQETSASRGIREHGAER